MLKGQDIVVLLKLVGINDEQPSFARKRVEHVMRPTEVHKPIRRATASGLVQVEAIRGSHIKRPNRTALLEFLVHGLKYVFPAERGTETRGVPTGLFAEDLKQLVSRHRAPIPVWPWAEGTVRGLALEPLYRTAPAAALNDPALHQLLALCDAIRDGRARDRSVAVDELSRRLGSEVE